MLLSALSLCGSFALLWRQQHIRVSEGKRHWTIQLIAMSAVVHASLAEVQMPRLFNLSISGLSKEEMGFITAKLLCFPVLVTDWNSKSFHIYKIESYWIWLCELFYMSLPVLTHPTEHLFWVTTPNLSSDLTGLFSDLTGLFSEQRDQNEKKGRCWLSKTTQGIHLQFKWRHKGSALVQKWIQATPRDGIMIQCHAPNVLALARG